MFCHSKLGFCCTINNAVKNLYEKLSQAKNDSIILKKHGKKKEEKGYPLRTKRNYVTFTDSVTMSLYGSLCCPDSGALHITVYHGEWSDQRNVFCQIQRDPSRKLAIEKVCSKAISTLT